MVSTNARSPANSTTAFPHKHLRSAAFNDDIAHFVHKCRAGTLESLLTAIRTGHAEDDFSAVVAEDTTATVSA